MELRPLRLTLEERAVEPVTVPKFWVAELEERADPLLLTLLPLSPDARTVSPLERVVVPEERELEALVLLDEREVVLPEVEREEVVEVPVLLRVSCCWVAVLPLERVALLPEERDVVVPLPEVEREEVVEVPVLLRVSCCWVTALPLERVALLAEERVAVLPEEREVVLPEVERVVPLLPERD